MRYRFNGLLIVRMVFGVFNPSLNSTYLFLLQFIRWNGCNIFFPKYKSWFIPMINALHFVPHSNDLQSGFFCSSIDYRTHLCFLINKSEFPNFKVIFHCCFLLMQAIKRKTPIVSTGARLINRRNYKTKKYTGIEANETCNNYIIRIKYRYGLRKKF